MLDLRAKDFNQFLMRMVLVDELNSPIFLTSTFSWLLNFEANVRKKEEHCDCHLPACGLVVSAKHHLDDA